MRKLMAMASVLVFASAVSSSWAFFGLEDVSYDGSLEVSGNSANNETDFSAPNDHRGRTATRVRAGASFTVTEGVKGRLELIRDTRQYGDASGPTSVQDETDMFKFHNAYVDFDDIFGFKARLGRQFVGNAGDLVWNLSPREDDSLTTDSIDGLLIQCRHFDFVHVDLFTGKANEDDGLDSTGGAGDATDTNDTVGDVNLTSIDAVLPTLVPGGSINVGLLNGVDSNTSATNDDNRLQTLRVGINGGVMENMLTYRAEFFQNMGQFDQQGLTGAGAATDLDYKGSALDLGVGFNSNETPAGKFGVHGNWVMASGDDNTQDDKDDSFHDFGVMGVNTSDRFFGEIFGKSNTLGGGSPLGQGINSSDGTGSAPNGSTQGQGLEVLNLGAKYMPTFSDKTSFLLDFYTFKLAEDSVTSGVGTTTTLKDDIGTEWDLSASYDHSENVNFTLGYAMLMPGDSLTGGSGAPDEDVTKWFARTKIKWGGTAQ